MVYICYIGSRGAMNNFFFEKVFLWNTLLNIVSMNISINVINIMDTHFSHSGSSVAGSVRWIRPSPVSATPWTDCPAPWRPTPAPSPPLAWQDPQAWTRHWSRGSRPPCSSPPAQGSSCQSCWRRSSCQLHHASIEPQVRHRHLVLGEGKGSHANAHSLAPQPVTAVDSLVPLPVKSFKHILFFFFFEVLKVVDFKRKQVQDDNEWHGTAVFNILYNSPSTSAAGCPGIRLSSIADSPFCSRMETLLTRWSIFSPSSCPVWRARADPSFRNIFCKTLVPSLNTVWNPSNHCRYVWLACWASTAAPSAKCAPSLLVGWIRISTYLEYVSPPSFSFPPSQLLLPYSFLHPPLLQKTPWNIQVYPCQQKNQQVEVLEPGQCPQVWGSQVPASALRLADCPHLHHGWSCMMSIVELSSYQNLLKQQQVPVLDDLPVGVCWGLALHSAG